MSMNLLLSAPLLDFTRGTYSNPIMDRWTPFVFNWAPTAALRAELLALYRPVAYRFEDNNAFVPHILRVLKTFGSEKGAPSTPSEFYLSTWLSIFFAVDLMRNHEVQRGYRYLGVVVCRPDGLLHVPLIVSEYNLTETLFHNYGNQNTMDMLFIGSSEAIEKMGCIMRFFGSNKWYGSFGAHNPLFLPQIIPDITGLVFASGNDDFSSSKDPSLGHGGTRFHIFPNKTRSKKELEKSVWPYRKTLCMDTNMCSFPSHDREERSRCSLWTPNDGFDQVCISITRTPMPSTPIPIKIDLQIKAPVQGKLENVSLRDFCIALPQLKRDIHREEDSHVVSLMVSMLLDGLENTPNGTENNVATKSEALAHTNNPDSRTASGIFSLRVAVLSSGNMRSYAFFADVVMPKYKLLMWYPGYELFFAIGDTETGGNKGHKTLGRKLTEKDILNATTDYGVVKNISLLTMPFVLEPLDGRASNALGQDHCPKGSYFSELKLNHIGLLNQFHKLGAVFAAMRSEELRSGRNYDYVVRTRPDLYPLARMPHISKMFASYRYGSSSGEGLETVRTQFGGISVANLSATAVEKDEWPINLQLRIAQAQMHCSSAPS